MMRRRPRSSTGTGQTRRSPPASARSVRSPEKLSADPRLVGAEDWGSLHEVGLDDEGCLEVAHIVGVFNHLTRLADGFGLRVDPATLAAASGGPPLRRPSSAR